MSLNNSCAPFSHWQDSDLLTDAFDCVYKARAIASPAYLPDIHATVWLHRISAPACLLQFADVKLIDANMSAAQLGAFCVQSGNSSDAVRHYESALALDSHHVTSLVGLASLENSVSHATGLRHPSGGDIALVIVWCVSHLWH